MFQVAVPDPLRTLWDRYKARQAAEGKRVHTGGGFSGKGFKFDEAEAALVNEKKKFQKAALGLQVYKYIIIINYKSFTKNNVKTFISNHNVSEVMVPLSIEILRNLKKYQKNIKLL